jgi:hypothetical protein
MGLLDPLKGVCRDSVVSWFDDSRPSLNDAVASEGRGEWLFASAWVNLRHLSRPPHPFVRIELRRAVRALRRELFETLPSEHELEHLPLEPIDAAGPAAGSRPQLLLRDEVGRRYMFKQAPPDMIAAELFAWRVRALAGRLHVPTARRTLGQLRGMLQPMIPVVGALERDPQRWSPLQCEAMLHDHPWEWLFANLDTHVDQYVLVGEEAVPLNIDWDHSLLDLQQTTLTRFNRRSATVAPIRNLLYAHYVQDRVSLDFMGMQLQARKAAELPDAAIVELLDRYVDELGLPDARRLALHDQVLRRKASLADDFDALVESLRHERDDQRGLAGRRRTPLARMASRARDAWQRLAIEVLHPLVLRPVLRGYRALLRLRSPGA